MTWLMLINTFLQFLFIRLTRHENKIINEFKLTSASMTVGGIGVSGSIEKYKIETYYSIQGYIVPLTGWWSDFIYIGGHPYFYQITKSVVK